MVLDIIKNLYNGFDYLPTMYDIMIQEKNCVSGVVTDKGYIIGFVNVRVSLIKVFFINIC